MIKHRGASTTIFIPVLSCHPPNMLSRYAVRSPVHGRLFSPSVARHEKVAVLGRGGRISRPLTVLPPKVVPSDAQSLAGSCGGKHFGTDCKACCNVEGRFGGFGGIAKYALEALEQLAEQEEEDDVSSLTVLILPSNVLIFNIRPNFSAQWNSTTCKGNSIFPMAILCLIKAIMRTARLGALLKVVRNTCHQKTCTDTSTSLRTWSPKRRVSVVLTLLTS